MWSHNMLALFTLRLISAILTTPQNPQTQGHLTQGRRKIQRILVQTTDRVRTKRTEVAKTVAKLPIAVKILVVKITVERMS